MLVKLVKSYAEPITKRKAYAFAQSVICVVSLGLYYINRFLLKGLDLGLFSIISRGYLSDFLAPLVVFSFCNAVFATFGFHVRAWWVYALYIALLSLGFEFVLPLIYPTVADVFDVVAYCAGGITFFALDKFIFRQIHKI